MNQPQQQQQAAATAPPSCFKSKQQMIDAAGSEGLVCLHFPASTDKANLYAHKSFLRCCSGVMKTLLDEDSFLVSPPQQQQPSKVAKLEAGTTAAATAATAAAAADADASVPVIPVTDADTIAWEEALALVYPMPPGLQIGWDNAKRLLLLADKYDAKIILERIRCFFTTKKQTSYFSVSTELEEGLTTDTAFSWLLLFSKCNMDDLASTCISYILARPSTALPAGFSSSGLQPKHLEQLCVGLQRKTVALQAEVNSLSSLKDSPKPHYGHRCSNCQAQWYMQPNGVTPAPHCIKCGIAKQRGL